jgi:hypothetical protein
VKDLIYNKVKGIRSSGILGQGRGIGANFKQVKISPLF